MCKELTAELERGTQACKDLVDHLHAMGGASRMTMPVRSINPKTGNPEAWIVEVRVDHGEAERDRIIRDAIRRLGVESQSDMMIEEAAELILAILHRRRLRVDDGPVAEEIADVQVMLDQMKVMIDRGLVERFYWDKIHRLRQRLEMLPEEVDHA